MKPDDWVTISSSRTRAPVPDLRAAWLSLLLVVPSFVLAFVLREGIIGLLDHPVGPGAPPTWVMLAAAPALLVSAVPTIPTWHYGHRARRSGVSHALLPFGIAVALVVAFMLITPYPLHR